MKERTQKQILVWDPLVRVFHWLLVMSFFIAYFLEDRMLNLHVLAGSIVSGLLVFRLIWGVVGTEYSRFADFSCSFRQIKQHLKSLIQLRSEYHAGHTPVGGVMIIMLLTGLLIQSLSGIVLYGLENTTSLFSGLMSGIGLETILFIENLHGLIADMLMLFVLFHIAGVLFESVLQRQNLIMAMITGYKTFIREKI